MVTIASLAVLAMIVIPSILADVSALSIVYGYVSVNGVGTNGIAINLSCNGSKTTNETFSTLYDVNHHAGYYQFDIANGSYYSVQATYNGVSSWANFTATGSNIERNLLISSTSTVTATPTPTPTPHTTVTPTPRPTPTIVAKNTATSTQTVTDTSSLSITPTATADMSQTTSFGIWVWAAIIIGIFVTITAVIGVVYFTLLRK